MEASTVTVRVLIALYAVLHARGLTQEEAAARQRVNAQLSPEAVGHAIALLCRPETRAMGVQAMLDLGYRPLVFQWLGARDEAHLEAAHGLSISEALARDSLHLGALGRGIENPSSPLPGAVRRRIADVWSERAARLLGGLPDTASPVTEALEQALAHGPSQDDWLGQLYGSRARASAAAAKGASSRWYRGPVMPVFAVILFDPSPAVWRAICEAWPAPDRYLCSDRIALVRGVGAGSAADVERRLRLGRAGAAVRVVDAKRTAECADPGLVEWLERADGAGTR